MYVRSVIQIKKTVLLAVGATILLAFSSISQTNCKTKKPEKRITVSVNLNGGTVNDETGYTISATKGTVITLKTPRLKGYGLYGYYVPRGKIKLTKEGKYVYTVGSKDVVLKALWGSSNTKPLNRSATKDEARSVGNVNIDHVMIGCHEGFSLHSEALKNTPIEYMSSNKKIVKVDSKGKLVGVSEGLAHVNVRIGYNIKKVNVIVKCEPLAIGVTSDMLNKKTVKMKEKTSKRIKVYFKEECYSNSIKFSISNKCAVVSKKGVIYAKKSGKAKITIKAYNGKKAYINLIVSSGKKSKTRSWKS